MTLTTATALGTRKARFGPVEGASVRYREDGTNPTASVGHLLEVGDILDFDGKLTAIKFIRTGGTDASIPVSYLRS